jgi:hypothetical protein
MLIPQCIPLYNYYTANTFFKNPAGIYLFTISYENHRNGDWKTSHIVLSEMGRDLWHGAAVAEDRELHTHGKETAGRGLVSLLLMC